MGNLGQYFAEYVQEFGKIHIWMCGLLASLQLSDVSCSGKCSVVCNHGVCGLLNAVCHSEVLWDSVQCFIFSKEPEREKKKNTRE